MSDKPSMAQRTAAVQAKYPTMYEILTRAAKPGNWLAIITLVIEFLGPWLDKCINTEEEFISLVQKMGWMQTRRLERKTRDALEVEGYDRKERNTLAEKAVDEGWSAMAMATEEELVACFHEFKR